MLSDEQLDQRDYESIKTYNLPRTVDNFIKALEILKTLQKKDTYTLQGGHDEIYVFAGPPTSDEQQIELDRLGFRYDEDCESWRMFT
jgi:hypothetical protein